MARAKKKAAPKKKVAKKKAAPKKKAAKKSAPKKVAELLNNVIHIRISDKLLKRLDAAAKKQKVGISAYVRDFLNKM